MKEIRLLEAGEIDARVGQVLKDGDRVSVTLLLYKDARCDMAILDELYGPMGWKRSHTVINSNLFCTVEVRDPDTGEWVAKQDVGTESNTEPEKGQASDAFKRACVNWGIGRELYTAPRIKVELREGEYSTGSGPVRCWQNFTVSHIAYDDARNIRELVIVDRFGNVRYEMGNKAQKAAKSGASTQKTGKPSPAPETPAKSPEMTPQQKFDKDNGFWQAVEGQAAGLKPSKDYATCRDWFIGKRNPTTADIEYFDKMVELKISSIPGQK